MDTLYITYLFLFISFIFSIISIYFTFKTKKRYEKIALKLGNGEDIADILKNYISKVDDISTRDDQIIEYCNKLNNEEKKSIKKIGMVKYDAFENTKSKLSFSIALLNEENTGIILNNIYSEDSSNIYAKPIIKGTSKYNLTNKEKEAIEEAIKTK